MNIRSGYASHDTMEGGAPGEHLMADGRIAIPTGERGVLFTSATGAAPTGKRTVGWCARRHIVAGPHPLPSRSTVEDRV